MKPGSLLAPFSGPVPVISFGAGDGATDRVLLDPLQQARREIKYYPVDASQALLEMACAAAEDLDIETAGIKADISSPMHLVFASDAAESPKLLLLAGNTLGGFDPLDYVKHVAPCLHAGDRLVLDAEMYHSNGSLPTNESLRQFAFAPLAALGVSADDGEVRFEHKRDQSVPGMHVTAAHFRPYRDLRIVLPEREVLVERGERINLNFRYRFTPDALRALLTEHGARHACARHRGHSLLHPGQGRHLPAGRPEPRRRQPRLPGQHLTLARPSPGWHPPGDGASAAISVPRADDMDSAVAFVRDHPFVTRGGSLQVTAAVAP